MPKKFDEADFSAIHSIPIATRASKVRVEDIVDPRTVTGDGRDLIEHALPDMLAADALKRTARALRRAREEKREIIWLIGAHVVKVGLSGYISALMDAGYITCISTTGSAVIHDLELSFFGKTSEDVAAELPAGRFGMSKETSEHFNAAVRHGDKLGVGLGLVLIAIAEMIGAQSGIGYMIWNAWQLMSVDTMFVGLIVIALLGFAFTWALDEIQRWLLPWKARG